ncbi:predicted protein [Postia placenta Mad-698-R]|uniref:Uncharacterized protein n=1 Tax=Postia placenta MAD-698-R-SB12 TaxID=670580 RepID=A0A1X6NH83_9APHY|nr:hypothetical protein POSPLADRAFT_1064249 [Postia placenta MAD-698-R-SB12]EED81257.1 predicted protein [Postia placenta Mad-698-R]OSX67733.1 hypothetical protein POSPLADRAFT_1064249 [Postia placenta MAD-698-R-SB12]
MYNNPQLYVRDGTSDNGKLSTGTIIIIVVVCGSVVVLASILFLWRLLFRQCNRKKSNPLPPVQLLAHERQEHATTFADGKAFYSTSSLNGSMHKLTLQHAPSFASLLPRDASSSRQNSVFVDDATSAESIPTLGPPVSADNLTPPNPPFNPYISAESVESMQPSSSVPFSDVSSTISHVTSLRNGAQNAMSGYMGQDDAFDRRSVFADQWVPVGARSLSMHATSIPGPSVGRAISTNPRIPSSLSQSTTVTMSQQTYHRSQSQPRIIGARPYPPRSQSAGPSYASGSTTHTPPPPVPSRPAGYATPPQERTANEEPMRGRPRSATVVRPAPHSRGLSQDQQVAQLAALSSIPYVSDQPPPPRPPEEARWQPSRSRSRRNTLRKPKPTVPNEESSVPHNWPMYAPTI